MTKSRQPLILFGLLGAVLTLSGSSVHGQLLEQYQNQQNSEYACKNDYWPSAQYNSLGNRFGEKSRYLVEGNKVFNITIIDKYNNYKQCKWFLMGT